MSTKFKSQYDNEYSFVIRRVAEGNFKNLWQLKAKTPTSDGFIEIVDADMLATVLSKIGFMFEQDGL